jgi:hypothetical protein
MAGRGLRGEEERTYDDPISPKNAFSFATSGGLKLDCAFSKYCIGGIMAVVYEISERDVCGDALRTLCRMQIRGRAYIPCVLALLWLLQPSISISTSTDVPSLVPFHASTCMIQGLDYSIRRAGHAGRV